MAVHDLNGQERAKRECFLCTIDPKKSCYQAQLEGYILAVYERIIDGERTPIILLDTGTSRVEVHLVDHYYRSLVRELKARGDISGSQHMKLRIYHLPSPPITLEYNGRTRACYHTNTYTLAILEPDILLNITDLNSAEYCQRQYILNRLSPSAPNAATIRGNLVHYCFKELLKEHDHGRRNVHATPQAEQEAPLATLHRHLEQGLELNNIDLALANVSFEEIRTEVEPHLESLARWYEAERSSLWDMPEAYTEGEQEASEQTDQQVRAETFLLAPEIGLRGRLDLFWQQSGRQRLLELKTGGASGSLPRREHRWQVYGYHALLTVRRDSKMKRALATLLYTGTPDHAQAFGIPASIREIQRVNETRNHLIISHVTGIPPAPPGPSRCTKCSLLQSCQSVSSLLQWQPPEPDDRVSFQQNDTVEENTTPSPLHAASTRPSYIDTYEVRDFFSKYYRLLQIEGQAGEQQQALLWQTAVAERLERGTALQGLVALSEPTLDRDGWQQTFRCRNSSELREGDEILLSNGDPITGEVVSGTITEISSERVTVWSRELIGQPDLIDRYDNDLVHVRTLQNLLRWLQAEPHLRDLVAGKIRPRFIEQRVPRRADFNKEQDLAVERAVQMQDYLLIQGPPGTGKTSVIAEIVKRLTQQGQRVMLAAFTNQAVDNMLRRLDREGIHDYLRLGHERSVHEEIRPRLLKGLVEQIHATDPAMPLLEQVHRLLQTTPIVASTTATWSSDKYSLQPEKNEEYTLPKPGLYFDVAIIDEAGQLTIPAILGALRFAKRFILVGDEKQLPPLVLSKEAEEQGLGESLFSVLKRQDEEYLNINAMAMSACVSLLTQYRMNRWISHFSSTLFYDKRLIAHGSVANRRLALTPAKPPQSHPAIARAIDPAFPLVFLDTGVEEANEASKISNREAETVRELVRTLLERGIEQRDIGIIAPYRAQVANIRRTLLSSDPASGWQGLHSDSPMSVDTVDRFQGGERMIIIISFATTSEPALESQRRQFLTNPNRLNVALTRAQRKLILVGSTVALENLPIFGRLITYCRSMQTLLPYDGLNANDEAMQAASTGL